MKPIPEKYLRMMGREQRESFGKVGKTMPEIDAANEAKSEKELQKQIGQYLNQRGIVFMSPTFGKKTRIATGWPDFTFSYRGHFCVIEAKAASGKLSSDQERIIGGLLAEPNKANVCIAYDLGAVKFFLEQMEDKKLL